MKSGWDERKYRDIEEINKMKNRNKTVYIAGTALFVAVVISAGLSPKLRSWLLAPAAGILPGIHAEQESAEADAPDTGERGEDTDKTGDGQQGALGEILAEEGKTQSYEDWLDQVLKDQPLNYEVTKKAITSTEPDVWTNGNITAFLSAIEGKGMENYGTMAAYGEVRSEHLDEEYEKFLGENCWFNQVVLDQIEIVPKQDERAVQVNGGREFVILHVHQSDDEMEKMEMFVMDTENVSLFYPESYLGKETNIQGYFVGMDQEVPVYCYEKLSGG